MLARLQKLFTIALFTSAVVWGGVWLWFGHPGWAAVGTLSLLSAHAAVLAVEFVLLRAVPDPQTTPRATRLDCLRAWAGEVVANTQVFCWRQPFRSQTQADAFPLRPDGRRGVVLVHGFVCNRGFWNPWLVRLRARGISVIAPNLEPPFVSISRHAATIDRAVAKMQQATGVPPLVVAHSMGGLAVRHWLASRHEANRVHHVITVGTPHGGTWLARFARRVPGTEMAMNSAWLRQLAANRRMDAAGRFTCFYGNADNVVFPASSGQWGGADNRLIRATAHVRLAYHDAVWRHALERLAEDALPMTQTP